MPQLIKPFVEWWQRLTRLTPELKAAQATEREHAERMRRLRVVDLQADVVSDGRPRRIKDKAK